MGIRINFTGSNANRRVIMPLGDTKMNLLVGPAQNGTFPMLFPGGIRWVAHQMTFSPHPLVICGPSGSGKSTLLKQLLNEFGDYFGFSVSHTTRKPRPGEVHGRDYYYVERSDMEKGIKNGDFVEYAEFAGNMYGTSKSTVKSVQDEGRICILDIEIEGVKQIKKTNLNPRYVFIKPPSLEILEERLRGRATDTDEAIYKRLSKAREEMRYGEAPNNFDLVLVNDDVDETYKNLRNFLIKDIEELKKQKR